MRRLLYIIGGFMIVLGLSTLIVQDPGKGLTFLVILVLVVVITTALVRTDKKTPPKPDDD